jgi:16S rRNA (uracil1498-N3)-methyltransferase
MRFFFLQAPPEILEGLWTPPEEIRRHLRALRIAPHERVLFLLPQGGAVVAEILDRPQVMLHGLCEAPRLPLMPVTLATAWPKGKRAEDLVLRACEAGIGRIVPMICERSVAGKDDLSLNQMQRLQRIARESCQQLGRPTMPILERRPISVFDAEKVAPEARPVCLSPGSWPLMMELGLYSPKEVLLAIGPEGGFSDTEQNWMRERGWSFAGLLPTILRVEAAGPLAGAICQHWFFQLHEGANHR